MVYEHKTNKNFENVLREASYKLPDGMPVLYSTRLFIKKSQERIAGNDVIFDLVQIAKEKGLKIFVIGTTEDILSRISKRLYSQSISHQVFSPPFKPIEEFDFDKQAELINSFNPDIVFVGLGCPKQEIWMHRMNGKINAHMYGLGGALLLYAGIDTRAPKWMRTLALEWIYRLILEPKRLWKRYLVTNTYFCFLFLKEVWKRVL
jgi:N-acetylglucosaminyldiphosphoundecaprenol N-acetyl-beta-D-mannosaminyltransferase